MKTEIILIWKMKMEWELVKESIVIEFKRFKRKVMLA